MTEQFELVEKIKSYDRNADEEMLQRAYLFSMEAHGSQVRASGDPYFSHPLEVASILSDMKLDTASIVTALLHDTLEDTLTTIEEIKAHFGSEIAFLVDGVTKLSRLELQSDRTKQAENFRKLVLAMSSDIRVLLVKLADRLHNMRTLGHIPAEDKRRRISLETLEIYAPLAERIGMQEMKIELEELAFGQLYPEERQSILERLDFFHKERNILISSIIQELESLLQSYGVKGMVVGREKTAYSIWRKIKRKNIGFDQLSDIMAFRIIVDELPQVYGALGAIHMTYPMVPGRFKDYISCPKPNKYQSIHTTVIGPQQSRIEIQIRTPEMDYVAELGVAAHWEYKEGVTLADTRQYRWLRGLLDILEHSSGPEEFLEHTKLEMFQDQVFCFTPQGDVISLPHGATPIDFAYAVHSEVGDQCIGAKINGCEAPLKTPLHNGDQVEIITSHLQNPLPIWERYAATGKARARVRRYVRTEEQGQYTNLGRSILKEVFQREGLVYDEVLIGSALETFGLPSLEDLCASIGKGQINAIDILYNLYPDHQSSFQRGGEDDPSSSGIPIKGLIPGVALHFAECCHPIPGDRIRGKVEKGKGLTVHTSDCDVANGEDTKGWLTLSWEKDSDPSADYVARISLMAHHKPGALGSATSIIGKHKINIVNFKLVGRQDHYFELHLDLQVHGAEQLNTVIAALRSHKLLHHVERCQG
jgi:GTP pyrophosphokinase